MTKTTLRWTRYAVVCRSCNRRFRIDLDTLAETRKLNHFVPAATDAQIATYVEFCMECSVGAVETGEFVEENPAARRWDPKGWALDTLAKSTREAVAALAEAFKQDGNNEKLRHLTVRCTRRAFVAEALRDRIDGKF